MLKSFCYLFQEWFDTWIETDTQKGKFNKAIVQLAVHKQRAVRKMPIFRSCDLNAMVTVVEPSLITETQEVFATVEIHGKYTRGMMVVDWGNILEKPQNITLVNAVNTSEARPFFDKMLL